jgi:hypothetical protein
MRKPSDGNIPFGVSRFLCRVVPRVRLPALAYDPHPTYKNSVFEDFSFGATVLEIDDARSDVILVNAGGEEIYRSHVTQ